MGVGPRSKRPVPGQASGQFPYSPALIAGDLIFVSGQVGIDPHSGELAGADVESQTEQVIANLEMLLMSAGVGLADVVRTTVFLTRAVDFEAMNRVYRGRFPQPYPTRSTVVVKALARRDLIVEVDAIALRPGSA
jgi:2-iminobutanoate/2-iminopropanoate deaminase